MVRPILTELPLDAFEAVYLVLQAEDRAVLACCSKQLHTLCASRSALLCQLEIEVPADRAWPLSDWLTTQGPNLQHLSVTITKMWEGYEAGFEINAWVQELSAAFAAGRLTSLQLTFHEADYHCDSSWAGSQSDRRVKLRHLEMPQLKELSLDCSQHCPLEAEPEFAHLTALTRLTVATYWFLNGNLQLPHSLHHLSCSMEVQWGQEGWWDTELEAVRSLRALHVECVLIESMDSDDWPDEHGPGTHLVLHMSPLGKIVPQLEELGVNLSSIVGCGYVQLAGGEALPALRRLQLTCIDSVNARFLTGVTAITQLCLDKCQQLPGLPDEISQLSALQALSVEGCDSVASLAALQHSRQLSRVSLTACGLEALNPQELHGLKALKALDLAYSKLPNEASLRGSLSQLTRLSLDVSQAAGLAAALPGLAGLARLDLELCLPAVAPAEAEDKLETKVM